MITKIENFLPEQLFKSCQNISDDLLTRNANSFTTNLKYWEDEIVKDSFPVLVHFINRESDLYSVLKNGIENKTGYYVPNTAEIMFYYWTRYSYIPWHNDGIHDYTLTIYLNESWDKNFGGMFLYSDATTVEEIQNNDVKGIFPKRNLGVLQKGGTFHCTTPVHYNGNMRKTIQVFLSKNKQ